MSRETFSVRRGQKWLPTVQGNRQARPLCLLVRYQTRNDRSGKHVRPDRSAHVRGFPFDRTSDRIRVGVNNARARLNRVVQQVRAELKVKKIGRDADHAQEQYDRNHRHEEVRDDEPVSQTPKHTRTDPRNQTHNKIDKRRKNQKTHKGQEPRCGTERARDSPCDVKNEDREGNAI